MQNMHWKTQVTKEGWAEMIFEGRNVRMKSKTWIIAIVIAFLAVISASCAKAAGKELTDDEVVDLYNKAKEVYGWFDLTTIPYDAEKYIEADGERYFEDRKSVV